MSKSKSSSKSAKSDSTDILTKVKDAAIVKPAQTIAAKSKELAKSVAGKEEKKSKKSKKAKEPTPEPSDSDESASSASSESESEAETTKPVVNGKSNGVKKPAPKKDSSDESESEESEDSDSESESEEEVPKPKGTTKNTKTNVVAPKVEEPSDDSSDASAEDSDEDSDAGSDTDSDDASSEDEKPSKAATKKADLKNVAPTASASESEADDSDDSEESDEEEKPTAKANKRKAEEDTEPSAKKSKTEELDTSRGANLFVGNLSWNIDEAWLKEAFEEFGEVTSARIMTDRDSGRSKGFGYVEFSNAEDAAKAHAAKAGAELDGRNLNVDFANPRPDKGQQQENRRKSYGDQVSEASDTLFLGNLSFDVGQESISEAFAPHGTIMSVRLPTDRETGAPKGFGYVTFSSVEEAQGALEAMQGAYIDNRPIRLDYSTPRPQNNDSPGGRGRGGFGGGRGDRGGFGGRGGARGGRGGRGGSFGGRGDRGGFGGRGGRGGRGGSTNRGGFGDFSGRKTSFD